jgi:hypothetical protein
MVELWIALGVSTFQTKKLFAAEAPRRKPELLFECEAAQGGQLFKAIP